MELNKKITSHIWDSCAKQIVDGYVYVKMDDIIKLDIEKEDFIMDDLEITPVVREKVNMDSVANYLISEGFKYEESLEGKSKMWIKK